MSRKVELPDYIVARIKKFYIDHDVMTDPSQIVNTYLDYLTDKEMVTLPHNSVKSFIIDKVTEAINREPKPKNDVEIFHRAIGIISGYLHKNKLW